MTAPITKSALDVDLSSLGGGDLMESTAAKYLIPALIGGLGGGAVGGFSSAKSKERPGETPGERRMRILRNALGMGVAGAGLGAAVSGVAQNLPNLAPNRTIWEDATAPAADDLSARVGLGLVGGGAGAGVGAAGGLIADNKINGEARRMADSVMDSRRWGRDGAGKLLTGLDYEAARDAAVRLRQAEMAPLNTSRLKSIGAGAKWMGLTGLAAGLAAPELASLADTNFGSGVGGVAGGLAGSALGRNPKSKAISALIGMLIGGVTPRLGGDANSFRNG